MHKTTCFLVVLCIGLLTASTARPCTRVLWAPEGGHVYVGRTNDWTGKLDSAFGCSHAASSVSALSNRTRINGHRSMAA